MHNRRSPASLSNLPGSTSWSSISQIAPPRRRPLPDHETFPPVGVVARSAKRGLGRLSRRRSAGGIAMKASAPLFTATELSFALDLSRHEFFLLSPKCAPSLSRRRYGEVPVYAVALFPKELRARLEDRRIERGCSGVTELVRRTQQDRRRTAVSDIVLYSRLAPWHEAFDVQKVLDGYFAAIDSGIDETKANVSARSRWLRLFGKRCSERTIRRIASRVHACGGPELAPIDAYADQKSVPHARGGRAEHHGAAVAPAAPLLSLSRPPAASTASSLKVA